MKLLWLIIVAFLPGCRQAVETRFFRGVSSDQNWPQGYIIEVRGEEMAVHVEQPIGNTKEWGSWGDAVKTTAVTKNSISFTFPWGVVGKALPVECVLSFDRIADEGFDASLTVESFQEDKTRKLRFSRVSREQLAPWSEAELKKRTQKPGDDQSANKPADKGPSEGQPLPPGSKDAPR